MALVLKKVEDPKPSVIVASAPPEPKPAQQNKSVKKEVTPKAVVHGNSATIVAALRKLKGDALVVAGNAVEKVKRLATGVFEFDFYLGGGFPEGRYTIVYGPESSGKTNLCLLAAAEAQRRPEPCNKVVWVNVEQSFDPEWAAQLGVDVEKLILVNPGYGEEAVDAIDALVRADDVAALFVDSVAALVSSKEIAQSAENFDVGTSALMIKRLVNKLMVAFGEERRKGHYPCVVLINQTRFKIGVMFGDPETMPGGEAQKFLSSLRVRLYGKNKVVKEINSQLPIFKETSAIVKKSKVPIVATNFSFDLCMVAHGNLKVGDTKSFGMVSNYLKEMGILNKVPKGYTVVDEEEPDGKGGYKLKVWPTLYALETDYYAIKPFRMNLQKKVIDAYGGKMMLVDEPIAEKKEVSPGVKVDPATGEVIEEEAEYAQG